MEIVFFLLVAYVVVLVLHGLTNVKICHDCVLRDQPMTHFLHVHSISFKTSGFLLGSSRSCDVLDCSAPRMVRNCYAENFTTIPWHIVTDIFVLHIFSFSAFSFKLIFHIMKVILSGLHL